MPSFQTASINVVGGTYENRSRSVSSQRTVNMFPLVNKKGTNELSLQSFAGQKFYSEITGSVDRGQTKMAEEHYRVLDETLYTVDTTGFHSPAGSIDIKGSDRCVFSNDGDNLVIIASKKVYVYTKSTDTLKLNTNVNLVGVISVTVINNQFIYTTPTLSFMSQPNDPFDVSGLDAIGAESSPDNLVGDYAFNQTIYRFGERTTEPWYNTGVGSPPIDRIEGQQMSVGLTTIHSVANTDRFLYWLGDDKCIYRASGGSYERISDDGISNDIEGMSKIDDAYGYVLTLQGQDFYIITFPTGNKTFAINEGLGVFGWFELRSYKDKAYSATSLVQVYDKLIVANKGKLLTLELDNYTQDTDVMIRERITADITPTSMGLPTEKMLLSSLYLDVETGVGLISGQGENPRILIETSIDGGRSFAHSQWVDIGRLGNYNKIVRMDDMITGNSFRFRITMSDPVPLTIFGARVKLRGVNK